jgi:hypothetical protein
MTSPAANPPPDTAQRNTALFTGLVLQHANLASIYLGRVPNPETGKAEVNLEAASLFIDTLEMLEAKTRGNLSPDEAALLGETLTNLRFAFVQAANQAAPPTATPQSTPPSPSAPAPAGPAPESQEAAGEEGSHRKFVKRY